jgi:hypothetical protein
VSAYSVLGLTTFDSRELHNNEIYGLLASIVGQSIGLVVVARDCPHPLPESITAHPQVLTVLRSGSVGISRARNIGLKWIAAQAVQPNLIIGFPDNDCTYPDHFVDRLCEAIGNYDLILGGYAEVGGSSLAGSEALTLRTAFQCANSAGLFCTWDAAQTQGGFDENLGVGSGVLEAGEDLDFVVSTLLSRRRGLLCPNLLVQHKEAAALRPERAGVHLAIAKRYVRQHPAAVMVLLRGLLGSALGATSTDLKTAVSRTRRLGARASVRLIK